MKIIYTINGREASWCVSNLDKYELQRIMNDGIGIPADPMLDVLVFAAYMGDYSTFYRFYRDLVEEFLDPDELFDTEPIEYFNTVISPLFDEDIKILDITDCDMTESKKEMRSFGKVFEDEDARNYLKRNGVEIPNNIDEIVSNFGMLENKKENKMNEFSRLREAFEDASFDIADRFVTQARKVVNNIADNISGIYADEEMSPHQNAWLDEVVDAFKILKVGASKLRDGSITPCQFLDYIERFMAVTEDEDVTDDYLALWPIRKMFTSSCGLRDSKWVESVRHNKMNKKKAIKEAKSHRLREDGDKKLSDYVQEDDVIDAFKWFAHDEIGEIFDTDFEDDIIDMMLEWFEPVMADVMNMPFSKVAKMMGETGSVPSDPSDINIDDLAYAIWDKAAPDDYEDQINIAFC